MSDQLDSPISALTRYCAVYGFPVRHSASPAMQNAGIAGLKLDWRYLAFEVHPDNLRTALEGARRMKFIGINLTVPHKLLAMEMMDVLDESAKTWGAVNTVRLEAEDASGSWRPLIQFEKEVPENIRMHGFNTDADAITRSIREDLSLELLGATVLLLGAGGAGRVAALKLATEGVKELYLVNRTLSKAEEIAAQIRKLTPGVIVKTGYPGKNVDLTVNATSLGLKPQDPLPFDTTQFCPSTSSHVYDMIYRPAKTPFLRMARESGCKTANGIGMLLYQGAKALEIWSGKNAPIPQMRTALEKNIYV